MMTVQSYLTGVDAASGAANTTDTAQVPLTPEGETLVEVQIENQEAVRTVTREQLQDLSAVLAEINAGKSITRGTSEAAVKDIQEIFVSLGINIGSFGLQKNGVDGEYGSTMTRVVSAFQTEKGLPVTGEVDQVTYDALLISAGLTTETSLSLLETTQASLAEAEARAVVEAKNLEAARARVASELDEKDAAVKALETNTTDISEKAGDLTSRTQELTKLEGELTALRARLSSAEAVDARVATYDAAQEVLTREQAELQAVQTQLADIEGQLTTQEASFEADTQTSEKESAEAIQAQQNLDTVQATFDALNVNGGVILSVEAAQNSYDIYEAAAQTAEKKALTSEAEWSKYHTNYPGLGGFWTNKDEIAVINKNASQAAKQVVELAKQALELAQAKVALDAAQTTLTSASGEAAQALTTLEATTRLTEGLQTQVQDMSRDVQTAQTEFEAARITVSQVRDGAARISTPEDTGALLSQVANIEGKTGTLKTKIAQLEASLTTLRAATAGLTTTVETESEKLATAQRATPEVEARDESARNAVARAQRETQEAQKELVREQTAEEALAALELLEKENGHGAIKAIQEALIALGVDLGATGADGDVGPRTRAGIEAHPQVVLDTLASYIDTTDNTINEERVSAERPADADAIDAALAQLDSLPHTERADHLLSMASQFTNPSLGGDIRNKNAQYISLKLQELGLENDPTAQRLMEQIMAQGKGNYEQETPELQLRQALVDGSNRFAKNLARFPENFNGSYYKIGNKLQSAGGRAELEAGMQQGVSGNANQILDQIFGVHADYLATRMHIVTGQGQDGDADMSLELAGGIMLSNAYYDEASGAIYAVVAKGNGCEGNLVVIPVEPFIPPVPRVVPRQQVVPGTPQEPVIPEPEGPRPRRICSLITNTWILVYPDGIRVDTGEKCRDTPGGGGGENGKVSTNPDDSDTDAGEDTGTEGGEGND